MSDIILVKALDERAIFIELVEYFFGYSNELTITFWGHIADDLLIELKIIQCKNGYIRSKIFKERNFRVDLDSLEKFLASVRKLNFDKISWGISIDKDGIVLARSKDDISICSRKHVPVHKMCDFLNNLKHKNLLSDYEQVSD